MSAWTIYLLVPIDNYVISLWRRTYGATVVTRFPKQIPRFYPFSSLYGQRIFVLPDEIYSFSPGRISFLRLFLRNRYRARNTIRSIDNIRLEKYISSRMFYKTRVFYWGFQIKSFLGSSNMGGSFNTGVFFYAGRGGGGGY